MSIPLSPLPRPATERVIDLTEASPLDELARAYADRLTAISAGAGPAELETSEQLIRDLERICRMTYTPVRRAAPDPALFLG